MGTVKRLLALGLCVLVLLPFMTGCSGTTENAPYEIPETITLLDSGVVANNENFELLWDKDIFAVQLKNKQTGEVWSTVPYDSYLEMKAEFDEFYGYYEEDKELDPEAVPPTVNDVGNINLNSPVFVDYYRPDMGSLENAKAFNTCMEYKLVNVSAIENGIKMTFYFDEPQITFSLNYTLREDSMQVSLPLSEIVESGLTQLISVTVLPYMCSTVNVEDKSNYVMLPVGSGALMYTDQDVQYNSRKFTGKVYGLDPSAIVMENVADEQAIRLPVYGVKNGDSALLSIVENGEGAASIVGDVGHRNGYSTAYTVFDIRGNDVTEAVRAKYADRDVYQGSFDKDAVYTIGYYPLSGEDASYVGMANCFREYLKDTGNLVETTVEQKPYQVEFLGGSELKEFVAGFPYYSLQAATTFEQAQAILKELVATTGKTPAVTLDGFGASGLSTGAVAGNYTFSSNLGGDKGHAALEEYCKAAGIPLFTNFDVVQFSASGSGFDPLWDTARTPSMQIASYRPITLNFRNQNEDSRYKISLLNRNKLTTALEKLAGFTSGKVSGVSLNTLGQFAYSDYSEAKYYLAGNLKNQLLPLLKTFRDNGNTLAFAEPNAYAAGMADVITDAPLQNGGYRFLDETIPFYEMVFAGNTALYTNAVNLSPDMEALLLRAVEAGVAPSFTLTGSYDIGFADAESDYYGTLYSDNKAVITAALAKYAPILEKIGGQAITAHEIPADGLSKTTFADGTVVWVNHSGKDITLAEGYTIEADSFIEGTWYVAPVDPEPTPDAPATGDGDITTDPNTDVVE